MRVIAFSTCIIAATALKLRESAMDDIEEFVMDTFDYDMDGDLNEEEFIDLATYLDEDEYLTDEELAWALGQYEIADPTDAIWLTDTFSSTASGEDAWTAMDLDSAITFGTKLGGTEEEITDLFYEHDWNGDGYLDLMDQDELWMTLMEDGDDGWDTLYGLEDTLWGGLETVWDMMDDKWEDEMEEDW